MPKPAYLTPEVEQFRSAFRAFVESKVTPYIGEWEQKGALPRAFWRAMGEHGFLCPWIAEADGGPEAPFGFSVVVCEELGREAAAVPFLGSAVFATAVVRACSDRAATDLLALDRQVCFALAAASMWR